MTYGDPIRITLPAALPVTLAELKAQTRVDADDEDALLVAYIRAATEMVENYTGLSLITSTWSQTVSAWPTTKVPDLILRRRPLRSVSAVVYLDTSNAPVILSNTVYRVIGVGMDRYPGGALRLANAAAWPTVYSDAEAVTVEYTAGFGSDHNAVPELIRHAVLMTAATFFGYREDVIMGSTVAELPFASKALLRYWRPLAVA